ncbi:unnamed protein product [Rotaria sordida]|uniref:Uncharacterized protein n=1 Tax=Rotaria sordida TaxID=392033 RepID=A0A819RTL6_9BILA|nr:unnamed protein product [Rotaria sordida]
MSDYLVNGFKIFLLGLPDLPTEALKNVIHHCEDLDQLRADLQRYPNSTKVIVCKSNHLIGVDELLMNHLIDTLYVLVNQEDQDIQEWLESLVFDDIIKVHNEKQLMRHLGAKVMLCYHNQGLEHRRNGDYGFANLCFLDSIKALDCCAKFI